MKTIITIIYSIVSLICLCVLLFLSGLSLYRIWEENSEASRRNLERIAAYVEGGEGNAVEREFKRLDRLKALTIYSKSNGIVFTISRSTPKSSTYLASDFRPEAGWRDVNWSGKPLYRELPLVGTVALTEKLSMNGDFVLEGVFLVLSYGEIFKVVIIGFFVIIGWLVISILIRIFVIPGEESRQDSPLRRREAFAGGVGASLYGDEPEQMEESPATIVGEDFPVESDIEEQELGNTALEEGRIEESLAAESTTESTARNIIEEKHTKEREADAPVSEESPEFINIKRDMKNNLFSPRTGLGWEEHLVTRLNTEIKRTASFDQDMALILIAIKKHEGLQNLEGIIKGVAKIVLELFLFQDLSFEYGDHGFATILPDADVKQAIKELEVFQRRITGAVFEAQHISVSIGVSTRNGRLVSGTRLLQESSRALQKSFESGTIIAFNPDPEKYRDLIAKKLKNA